MVQGGTGEPSSKKLHPFFAKADAPVSLEDPPTTDFSTSPPVTAGYESSAPENNSHEDRRRGKRRKTYATPAQEESEPKRQRRKRKTTENSLTGAILNHLTRPQPQPQPQPQQHATTSAAVEDDAKKVPSPPLSDVSSKPDDHGEAKDNSANDAPPGNAAQVAAHPAQRGQPKKILKFNPKTGRFGSPHRPRSMRMSSRMVCIKYGKGADDQKRIGDIITGIMEGIAPLPLDAVERAETVNTRSKTTTTKKTTEMPMTSTKTKTTETPMTTTTTSTTASLPGRAQSTHPFFSKPRPDGVKADDSALKPAIEKPSKIFLSTPVSPRKPRSILPLGKAIHFGIRSAGAKVPGAKHPMWPAQGMSHVRGEERQQFTTSNHCSSSHRKSKGPTTSISTHESLLRHVTDVMQIDKVRGSLLRHVASFQAPPAALRLPRKHFESGRKLRSRIRPELQARLIDKSLYEDCDMSADELSAPPSSWAHPGLEWLYRSLDTQLSAYDRSTCENMAWTQKYAPSKAAQVLQRGREAEFLRDWLQTLRVQCVESGSGNEEKDKDKSKVEGCPKRKRKKNKADDFIVDDEYESDSMYEVSTDDDDDSDPENQLRRRDRTIMRGGNLAPGGKNQKRLVNTVLLSGPHGCGKTAAVYAVAKELDFEVFEINSSSRRSGKDVLEKVGDMTRNHLVQHNRADPSSIDPDEVGDEIRSGKQGMMTAFFKPKEKKKEKTEAVPSKRGRKKKKQQQQEQQEQQKLKSDEGADGEAKTASGKSQSHKQSLILLEEVDILFEEDKQFWASLMGLIAQSKRPFIMTCNDEQLVPIQSLSLHGILRFSPSPSSLATDLCLLIAANEGHALRRSAVEALYRSRGDDLRATITELHYWCQIGVGDRRGGFDWFYLRWPKGCDRDEDGDVVRVVSGGTYCEGMGWLARDGIAAAIDPLEAEQEAMRQSWDHWQRDVGHWGGETGSPEDSGASGHYGLRSWAAHAQRESKCGEDAVSLLTLAAFESFCGAMSDADLCSSRAYATQLDEVIDATLPELPASRRDDFIIGQTLLDAEPLTLQVSTHKAVSTTLKSLAREVLRSSTLEAQSRSTESDCISLSESQSKSKAPSKIRSKSASGPQRPPQPLTEHRTTSILLRSFQSQPHFHLSRHDIALAFDPVAISPRGATTAYLDPSVLDRPLRPIVLDVAPYVRAIVLHDHLLAQRRIELCNVLLGGDGSDGTTASANGKRKRLRNTRSALSALEGGERRAAKREKWFGDVLSLERVLGTAGDGWTRLVVGEAGEGKAVAEAEAEADADADAEASPLSDELA